jgi:hypothetical protein
VIDPSVEPVAFNVRPDGRVAVEVDCVVRGSDGAVLAEGRVVHVYSFRDGLIARMDVGGRPGIERGSSTRRGFWREPRRSLAAWFRGPV